MNERIKQLWDTAAKLESDPSWEGQTKFMAKFAELIIKECADVATVNQYQSYTVGHYVLKHFGVE